MPEPSKGRIGKYKSIILTVVAAAAVALYLTPLEKISALTPSFIANNPIFANFFPPPVGPLTDHNAFRYGIQLQVHQIEHQTLNGLGPSIPASIVQRIHAQFHINLGLPL